jgi:8-oxo-dGTP pyrophosphatase MutT (NUDIX family)
VNITNLKIQITQKLAEPLPNEKAHQEVYSYARPGIEWIRQQGITPRESAVLILLYEEQGELKFPIIQRPEYDGVHSRQMALPGGSTEIQDKNLWRTAIRETEEEIGVDADRIEQVGSLSEVYIPPSNFLVKPFLGIFHGIPRFKADPTEVDGLYPVPLDEIKTRILRRESIHIPRFNGTSKVTCFYLAKKLVWGATAMILNEFHHVVRNN